MQKQGNKIAHRISQNAVEHRCLLSCKKDFLRRKNVYAKKEKKLACGCNCRVLFLEDVKNEVKKKKENLRTGAVHI